NNDGHVDIVTGNELWEQNVIYLNDGNNPPGFSATENFGTGSDDTRCVALGDVDGDSDLDIISGNRGRQNPDTPEENFVYLNDGGMFNTAPISLGGGLNDTRGVAVGDLNGDGLLDIVVGNRGCHSGWAGEPNYYCLNQGGTFGPATEFGGNERTRGVALADVDGDGDLDMVVGNYDHGNVVYLNNGADPPAFDTQIFYGRGGAKTLCAALADMNADGHLDILNGNYGRDYTYLNDGAGSYDSSRNFGTGDDGTLALALGDMDRDGDLDIVTGNFRGWASSGEQNVVYLNDGAGNFDWFGADRLFGTGSDRTTNVALGDVDRDDDLDIVTGNSKEQNVIYLNDGSGNFGSSRNFGPADKAWSLALGDMDCDGHLDIIVSREGMPNALYVNDGAGNFDGPDAERLFGTQADSLAVGDVDGDGDLDIIACRYAAQNAVYLNDGAGNFDWAGAERLFGAEAENSYRVALCDVDRDGDLDVVTASIGLQNLVYLNDGAGNFPDSRDIGLDPGPDADITYSLAVGDIDGDGDIDVISGNGYYYGGGDNEVHLNDGAGSFSFRAARRFGPKTTDDPTRSLAVGDVDGDGDLDIVVGNECIHSACWNGDAQNVVYLTGSGLQQNRHLPDRLPYLEAARPCTTDNAGFYSTPEILDSQTISIPYTLYDPDDHPVRLVRAYYSPNGGGNWLEAMPDNTTVTADLLASSAGVDHTFTWDTFASDFFGQADNIVFRIEAYPDLHPHANNVAGPYQRPYASATTFPFRVRGTQVQVMLNAAPSEGAIVFRLPAGDSRGAMPLADGAGSPYVTDVHGYLQGRGEVAVGDELIALLPMGSTGKMTMYYTNATPTETGLSAHTVGTPGVQQLTVSQDHPLLLFHLDVSLQWDARNDILFLSQLEYDLHRASTLLYDWTDGQAALGEVTVYHDREKWTEADILI
ncbi:FG-GAP repeat domain-containing protein, partial [Acidobacteriota bacterium]